MLICYAVYWAANRLYSKDSKVCTYTIMCGEFLNFFSVFLMRIIIIFYFLFSFTLFRLVLSSATLPITFNAIVWLKLHTHSLPMTWWKPKVKYTYGKITVETHSLYCHVSFIILEYLFNEMLMWSNEFEINKFSCDFVEQWLDWQIINRSPYFHCILLGFDDWFSCTCGNLNLGNFLFLCFIK